MNRNRMPEMKITLTADILNNPNQKCPISEGSSQGTSGESRANTGETSQPEAWVESRAVTSGGGSETDSFSLSEKSSNRALEGISGTGCPLPGAEPSALGAEGRSGRSARGIVVSRTLWERSR
jgi:hypothetical protein